MIRVISVGVLTTMVVLTSIAVIYSKYRSRMLFAQLQGMERSIDQFEVEWGKLQIELNTLGEHSRVEKFAYRELGMVIPDQSFSVSITR